MIVFCGSVASTVSLAVLGTFAALPLAAQEKPDTTITIRADGSTLEFQPDRISVKNGTTLRLRFVNAGTLPHNFVIPRSDEDIDALAVAAHQAGEAGFVPTENREKLLAFTPLASPGDTLEVTFVVPEPGEYTYVCLFPGHANSMLGTLRSLR